MSRRKFLNDLEPQEIFQQIIEGKLKPGDHVLALLPDDLCAKLAVMKKISSTCRKRIEENRPGFTEAYKDALRRKYTSVFPPFNFAVACRKNDTEVVKAHLEVCDSCDLNKNYIYPMPPGFLAPLPLAEAVKAGAMECITLLLVHGADPDAFCRHKENNKTPRELAGRNSWILKLFDEYKK